MKKILITSGGTKEYVDEVRVLTNISTGKLGSMIAEEFMKYCDYDIYYVYVKGSKIPWSNFPTPLFLHLHEVTDVQSVYDIMEKLVPEMDVVIHPMAVSDFGFKPIATKLKSNDSEAFIESMRERIYQTPKILAKIKEWNPKCFLISFKFENGLEHDELIRIAMDSMNKNGCDVVIANDKAEMKKLGRHRAYFLQPTKDKILEGKEEIANEIYNTINNL